MGKYKYLRASSVGASLFSATRVLAIGLLLLGRVAWADDAQPDRVEIDLTHPSHYWLAAGASATLPVATTTGVANLPRGANGWFDYEVSLPGSGWWRLEVDASPHLWMTEFLIDPDDAALTAPMVGNTQLAPGKFQVGWIWLDGGTHKLRVRHLFWTGFPQISGVRLERLAPGLPSPAKIVEPSRPVFELGKCRPLRVQSGGASAPSILDISFRAHDRSFEHREVSVPASSEPHDFDIDLPCGSSGDVTVSLSVRGAPAGLHLQEEFRYTVFDAAPVELGMRRGELVADIDATAQAPDFQSGETTVVRDSAGAYRETGDIGATAFSRRGGRPPAPGWYAYRLEGLAPGRPYLVEVEFPDDAPRVFVVGFRDAAEPGYPPSIGFETGAIWPMTDRMQEGSFVVWPASRDARLLVINVHDGMKAAVARICVFAAIVEEKAIPAADAGGRDFTIWSEEGDDFRYVVGEGRDTGSVFDAVDRYLKLARLSGASSVTPTVAVYDFALYPSRYNLAFSDQERDLVAAFLLGAQHYGLKVKPELYPRADELVWPPRDEAAFARRLLLSGDGKVHRVADNGTILRPPFYNALDPDVRRWYVDMIGELADRYKAYPSFSGIQLRASSWQNAALNNLVSLEWGYDAVTVRRFFDAIGTAPAAGLNLADDTPEATRIRRDLLLSAYRADWVRWRCEQMRDLYREIVARVRSARPDLKVYVSLLARSAGAQSDLEYFREAGLDPSLLEAIDGLTIVDSRFGHGAREASLDMRKRNQADLLTPATLEAFAPTSGRPQFLIPMQYVEMTGDVAPADRLGWPRRAREPWFSSAVEPPGRLRLARYASALALTDAFMLGDGGNGYVFGGEGMQEFMKEFTAILREPFERVPNMPELIVVRQRRGMFYVVNVTDAPVSARLRLNGADRAMRLSSQQYVEAQRGILALDLPSYGLAAFLVDGFGHVIAADVGRRDQ